MNWIKQRVSNIYDHKRNSKGGVQPVEPVGQTAVEEEVFYDNGLGDSTLTISCLNFKFYVHRKVITKASKVWAKMLSSSEFADESTSHILTLTGDDPRILKQALEIIYYCMIDNIDLTKLFKYASKVDLPRLQVLTDKYELTAVAAISENVNEYLRLNRELDSLWSNLL